MQRLKHYGTQLFPESWNDKIEELEGKLRIQRKVRYLTSIRVESPMVIGWLKPVVLLPQQLFKSFSETEIYAVLAHELAHIRREDFIVNLIQTVLVNVFFFHPGVWWMSKRVDDEREHCCDDLAVAATGKVAPYAKTLINVSELQLAMKGNTPSLAMAIRGKSKNRERGGFTGRIRRLFMANNSAGTFREGFATACILLAALFLGVGATGPTEQSTASASLLEIEKSEISSQKENIKEFEKPIAANSQNVEENQRSNIVQPPVRPAPPEPPVPPGAPFGQSETRIDALIMACAEGDFDFVQTLVNSGIDLNGIGSEGVTPLMMATNRNEAGIVEYLLLKGADVNQISRGWNALLEAADEGSMESMHHLLEAGANVNYYLGTNAPTAITMAASNDNFDCLKLLLKNDADINGHGKSAPPLHAAAEEDKRNIVHYLISKKVNINEQDAAGRTALMIAAFEGNKQIVKILVDAGADLSILDKKGNSVRDYARKEQQFEVLDYLSIEKRPDIHQATIDGHIEKVQRMVKNGVDVNTRDDYGRTALHFASAKNHNIDMRVLLDLGADLDAQDSQDRTPLMYAAAAGHGDAVALLVSKRVNVNIKDVDGMRAFEWAKNSGNPDLAKFLGLITESKSAPFEYLNEEVRNEKIEIQLEKNIQKQFEKPMQKVIERAVQEKETVQLSESFLDLRDFNIKEEKPRLLEAVRNGSIDQCRDLLNSGIDVNTTDDTGLTALMLAVMTDRMDIVKLLIEHSANVNSSSASGLTALHYAALENHEQLARLLLKNNAKVDARMRYSSTDGNDGNKPLVWEYIGATPLLIAIESGNTKLVSILLEAGANADHRLIKNVYGLKKGRETYLTLSEVVGLDVDFLKNAEIKISDNEWTPYKQALQMKDPAILALFSK